MQVVVDSLLTNYEQSGSGRVVLLLHGWGDDLRTFAQLRADLAKQFTVVSLDLPGFGQTQAPPTVWDLDNYAQFVQAFLQKLQVAEVYAVVGHSNGGALAIRGVAQQTLQAQRLVLLAAAGIRTTQRGRRLALKVVAKTGKVLTFWLPRQYRRTLQKKLYGAAGSDMLVVPHLQETFKKTVRQDVQADARQLTVPTLLVYGEQDRATPPLYGELYHQMITGSTLEVLASAGHFVHHDQATRVATLLQEFLA